MVKALIPRIRTILRDIDDDDDAGWCMSGWVGGCREKSGLCALISDFSDDRSENVEFSFLQLYFKR